MEKEKEEDIWSRKIIGWQWRRKTIFREGKYLFSRGKRRTIFEEGKYFEKENIWSTEEKKKNEEGKEGIIWRRKSSGDTN